MQVLPFDTSRFLSTAMSLTALAVFSTGALAQQLLTTTDTGTQGAGGSLLEVGYSRERTRVGRGEEKETERLRALDATYTYGLTETIDVYAGVSHVRLRFENEDGREHASGFSNTAIGAKWRFFDNEASGTSLAIVPEIALPVSSQREDDGLGAGRISGSLTLALSQTLPFGSLNFNAGIGRDRYRHGDDETIRSFSVAPVWEISERWTVALDTGIDLARAGGSTVRSKFSEITAVYAPTENVEVSIAYIRATDDEHPRAKTNAVAVGVAWAF